MVLTIDLSTVPATTSPPRILSLMSPPRSHRRCTNWLARYVLAWAAATLGIWLLHDVSFFDSYVLGGLIVSFVGLVALAVLLAVWLFLGAVVDLLGL